MDTASQIDALAERGYDDELISALLGIERADVAAFRTNRAPRPAGTVVFEVRDYALPVPDPDDSQWLTVGTVDVDPRHGYVQACHIETDAPISAGSVSCYWGIRTATVNTSMDSGGEAALRPDGRYWDSGPQTAQWSSQAGSIGIQLFNNGQPLVAGEITLQAILFRQSGTPEMTLKYARWSLRVF